MKLDFQCDSEEADMRSTVRMIAVVLAAVLLAGCGGQAMTKGASGDTETGVEAKVLVTGSPIHGANGVYFGPDGNLYVASVFGMEIIKMNPNTGEILDRIGPERGVLCPDDLTFGEDGSLYWTAILTGEVGKIGPDGKKSTLANLGPGVNPITIKHDDGRLFVGQAFMADSLYEVYQDGRKPRLIVERPNSINAFDFGPGGHLYAPSPMRGLVVRINVENGETTTVADGLAIPNYAVKFSPSGQLFALEQSTGKVLKINHQTGQKEVYAVLQEGLDNLAFNAEGRMFVSNNDEGSVVEVFPNGTHKVLSPGGIIAPGGLAVLPDGKGGERVYVADLWTLRSYDGGTGRHEGDVHNLMPRMIPPTAVSSDGRNLLLISYLLGGVVQVWDPEKGKAVATHPGFAAPTTAVRFQGDLVVSDVGKVVRNTAGKWVTIAELPMPTGLATRGDDLWAADRVKGTVFQLISGGTVLTPPRVVASGLSSPQGLAVGRDGSLLVVEAGKGSLRRIDLASAVVTTVASGLQLHPTDPAPVPGPFSGVAVGPSGAMYVAGTKTNVLYKIPSSR
jgi:sugar lactone lactonase YvrE